MESLFGNHIVQYPHEVSLCAGCSACEIVCSLLHDRKVSPQCNRVFIKRGTVSMLHEILTCQHCAEPGCYNNCPKKDLSLCIDENGIVYINEENCIGCGKCIKSCPFDPPRINMEQNVNRKKWKAKKCDLCRGRPEGPACIEYCQVRCIGLSCEPVPEPIIGKDSRLF